MDACMYGWRQGARDGAREDWMDGYMDGLQMDGCPLAFCLSQYLEIRILPQSEMAPPCWLAVDLSHAMSGPVTCS